MDINLNNCFPIGDDGSQGPLPKQQYLLESALDPKGPKYIAYVGGIGSGKTLIGCITVLSWAILYQGDYLVGRQYAPELRDTTLKTFLDIIPPELLVEHRVADGIVKIRTANGGVSNVLFRHLEEPDKHRSLNLSGFYIDEASQTSEAAFMLLQGRLRGNGLRKGIITSNPAGHDWIYKWFVVKKHIKNQQIADLFYLIKAPSTENVHLPDGYVETLMASWSEDQIKRDIYGSFDSFEGQIYSEFDRTVHVVQPFKIPDNWERIIGIDHGYRNPAAWIYGAIDYDGNIYIYREYYESERKVEDICKDNKILFKNEKFQQARIDPSVDAVRGGKGASLFDEYIEHLPKDFILLKAENEVKAGIDKVKRYLKIRKDGNPTLRIFNTCENLLEEMSSYRWKEQSPGELGRRDAKEEPRKYKDHAVDALRYLIMSQPDPTPKKDEIWDSLEYNSLEGSLYRELEQIKNPKPKTKDPWSGYQ